MFKHSIYVILTLNILLANVNGFKKLYKIEKEPGKSIDVSIDTAKVTVDTGIANNAFGQCKCDVTLNACDVYCCCDADCNEEIRAFWNENYRDYCAKNKIMNEYKPYSQCLSTQMLHKVNKRMGMQVTALQGEGLTCVTLDVGSVFSTYKKEVKTDPTDDQTKLKNDISNILLKQGSVYSPDSQSFILTSNVYQEGDMLLVQKSDKKTLAPFFLPQVSGFSGVCQNTVGVRYGETLDSSCQQFISDLSDAGNSFLNPSSYLYKDWGVSPGTKPSSSASPIAITVNSVWLLKSSDGTMTKTYDSSKGAKYIPVVPTYAKTAPDGCTLTNAVKEVFYNIQNKQSVNTNDGFTVSNAYIDIILQDKITITDTKFCQKAASSSNTGLPSQTKSKAVTDAEALVKTTGDALTKAQAAKKTADDKVTAIQATYAANLKKNDDAVAAATKIVADKKSAAAAAAAALAAKPSDPPTIALDKKARDELAVANKNLIQAKTDLSTLKSSLVTAKADVTAKDVGLKAAQTAVDKAQTDFDALKSKGRRLQKSDSTIYAFDQSKPAANSATGFKFTQRFSIVFGPKKDQTTTPSNGSIIYKSGNPGYLSEYPIIVSSAEVTKTAAAKVPQNGFLMYDHGSKGECIVDDKPNTVYDYHNRVLKFGQTQHLACSQSFNLKELADYCITTKWQGLMIFKQFVDKFQYVSKVGNPSISSGGDWVKVLREDLKKMSKGTWDADTNTCTLVTGFNIKILTSSLGFANNLQKYVVSAQIEYISDTWGYYSFDPAGAGTAKQDYVHTVFVSFVDVMSNQLLKDQTQESQFFLPKMPKDLFYPFTLNM